MTNELYVWHLLSQIIKIEIFSINTIIWDKPKKSYLKIAFQCNGFYGNTLSLFLRLLQQVLNATVSTVCLSPQSWVLAVHSSLLSTVIWVCWTYVQPIKAVLSSWDCRGIGNFSSSQSLLCSWMLSSCHLVLHENTEAAFAPRFRRAGVL
jgi:hypothetical protein